MPKFWVWMDGIGFRSSAVQEPDETKAIKGSVIEIEAPTRTEAITKYKHALSLYNDWLRGKGLNG